MPEKLNKEELVQLLQVLRTGKGSEEDTDALLGIIERNVPHPAVSDLIYFTEKDDEEVIDEALAYRPIQL